MFNVIYSIMDTFVLVFLHYYFVVDRRHLAPPHLLLCVRSLIVMGLESLRFNGGILILVGVDSVKCLM
jgi:hypothetical protein